MVQWGGGVTVLKVFIMLYLPLSVPVDAVHSFQGVLTRNGVVQVSIPVVFPACPVTTGECFTSIAAAELPPTK